MLNRAAARRRERLIHPLDIVLTCGRRCRHHVRSLFFLSLAGVRLSIPRDRGIMGKAEGEWIEASRDAKGRPVGHGQQASTARYVAAARQFLTELVEDPCARPTDQVAAGKALLQGPKQPGARPKSQVRPKVEVVMLDPDGGPPRSTQAIPADPASEASADERELAQRRPILKRMVEIMEDEGAGTRVRIGAARAILRAEPDVATDDRPIRIYMLPGDERG